MKHFYQWLCLPMLLTLTGDSFLFFCCELFHELNQKSVFLMGKQSLEYTVYLTLLWVFRQRGVYSQARMKYRMPG